MSKPLSEAISVALEEFSIDMTAELQRAAATAMGERPTPAFGIHRTGKIMDIRARVTPDGVEFSFPKHAQYLEFGTGLYGPFKQEIKPVNKKALAFGKDLGGGKKEFVFASVKGMTPSPFIRPTFHQRMIPLLVDALNRNCQSVKLSK